MVYVLTMRLCFLSFLLIAVLWTGPAIASGKVITFSTLVWPPYSGKTLIQGGASIHVVRTALAAVGYKLEIRFYPWQRTVHEAKYNPEIAGFFPEYYSSEQAEQFLYSDPIGSSPVGFAEHSPGNRTWERLDDLKQYTIGVVDGYINYEPFDKMVDDGEIRTDGSVSDTTNLRKVLAGRVDMAVVDINTFRHILRNDEILSSHRDSLAINPRLLHRHELFVCFKKTSEGKRLRELLNKGLKAIDARKVHQEYLDFVNR